MYFNFLLTMDEYEEFLRQQCNALKDCFARSIKLQWMNATIYLSNQVLHANVYSIYTKYNTVTFVAWHICTRKYTRSYSCMNKVEEMLKIVSSFFYFECVVLPTNIIIFHFAFLLSLCISLLYFSCHFAAFTSLVYMDRSTFA